MIDVDGIVVTAQAGEGDDVRLGDRAAQRFPLLADLDIVEIHEHCRVRHGGLRGLSDKGTGPFDLCYRVLSPCRTVIERPRPGQARGLVFAPARPPLHKLLPLLSPARLPCRARLPPRCAW